ncbi:MAG: DUF366 family protein [Bdellovibrionales bacterium]|nr:DUF366 family protein [Bdellovibrionales bacterium]
MRVETKWIEERMTYTGPELRPHFLLEKFRVKGSAVAAFVGPCEVKMEHLVDWEDRLANDFIRAKLMVHFLGEFFGISLAEGVLYQRLFMAIAGQEIARISGKTIRRDGDDLFWNDGKDERKLSVSIVTASPVSRLLHAGINLDASGAPVKAAGLFDLGVGTPQDLGPVKALVERILSVFREEVEGIEWACAKVRPVV